MARSKVRASSSAHRRYPPANHVRSGWSVAAGGGAGGAGLLLEAAQAVGVRDLLGQHLDCDLAAQAGIPGAVQLPHAPGPDWSQDLVGAEPRAGSERDGRDPT